MKKPKFTLILSADNIPAIRITNIDDCDQLYRYVLLEFIDISRNTGCEIYIDLDDNYCIKPIIKG